MSRLERITLTSHQLARPYKKYVDDIYLQTRNEEMGDTFHRAMNNLHQKILFKMEKPMPRHSSEHELTLSLLDFTVAVAEDGKTSFEFYRKPTKKPPVNGITYSNDVPYQPQHKTRCA